MNYIFSNSISFYWEKTLQIGSIPDISASKDVKEANTTDGVHHCDQNLSYGWTNIMW